MSVPPICFDSSSHGVPWIADILSGIRGIPDMQARKNDAKGFMRRLLREQRAEGTVYAPGRTEAHMQLFAIPTA